MIIDLGFGYQMKPDPCKDEAERRRRQKERQKRERMLCDRYGIDYDEILRKRGEECLLGEEK